MDTFITSKTITLTFLFIAANGPCVLTSTVCWSPALVGRYLPGHPNGDSKNYKTRAAAEEACERHGSACGGITSGDLHTHWEVRQGTTPTGQTHETSFLKVPCPSACFVATDLAYSPRFDGLYSDSGKQYGGRPIYIGPQSAKIYKRGPLWVVDFNSVDGSWSGTINWSASTSGSPGTSDQPWNVKWRRKGIFTKTECPSPRPHMCGKKQIRFCKVGAHRDRGGVLPGVADGILMFPLNTAVKSALSGTTDAVSPRLPSDIGCIDTHSLTAKLNALGTRFKHYPPTFPDSTSKKDRDTFWQEFVTVTKLQAQRILAGETTDADKYLTHGLPSIMKRWNMVRAAEAVRKDFPTHFPTELAKHLLVQGVKVDTNVIPSTGEADFVNTQVMLARIIGWAVATVSPTAFSQKWLHGRPRPEEIAIGVKHGLNTLGYHGIDVNAAARVAVNRLTFSTKENFTAYTEGAPRHPSYPAMHSAASTASLFLAVVLDLTDAQHMEAIKLDCAVASFRTYAGVHYESDNQAGLTIGQIVVEDRLPEMLAREYGSDKGVVRSKIQRMLAKWDWRREVMPAGPWKGVSTRCLATSNL